ncbi:molecular chaperone DnaJ [Leptolyngbya sp. BL0902]|uniref:J domain-containing protein n=1 Tax=Leptolyngbya sp. BL0902 TaxID=1115757 RepID=UPI0018E8F095|nr:J domain-containing protein [Leptolyngbya sp. BL0902]QQE65491.1 molecular chaperone DnaJ [Leptolyngbya sp. BL0902]
MKLDTGLFSLDFEDHHAVLGIPITADAKAVRKRYLMIARKLHPDSLSGISDEDAQQASDLLSKWVNPAYEALSQEKIFSEHQIILKLKGQGLRRSPTPPAVTSASAQTLLQASQVDLAYDQAVKALANQQYEQLTQTLNVIGQLSELNLVYLYRTSDGPMASARPAASAPAAAAPPPPPGAPAKAPSPPPRRTQAMILESYLKRAQDFEVDHDYSRAVLEMREALKAYPNSAKCHSYLASLYLKAGQATMAKVHAKRALDLAPEDEIAQAIQTKLERGQTSAAKAPPGKPPARGSQPPAKGASPAKGKPEDKGGGFFGGLFGGKKK